jgi:Tfp pilus assembly protein FimT
MQRRGVTLLEILLVIGILAVVGTVSVPMYREYQIRNDLNVATQQVTQGLARARLLSQAAKNDSEWGFYVPSGTLYKGATYAGRDSSFDEVYAMPSTITVSGLLGVTYSKGAGDPNETGSILLTAIDQEQRSILIDVLEKNITIVQGDKIMICHKPGTSEQQTMSIPDNAWPAHQGHGDYLGACIGGSSASSAFSVSSAVSSPSSSAASSVSSSAGGSCSAGFKISDGVYTMVGQQTFSFTAVASYLAYGKGGPSIPVTLAYSTNNGKKWTNLFNGKAIQGGETDSVTFPSGTQMILQENAYFKQNGWLTYSATHATNDDSGYTQLFTNGQTVPNLAGYNGQTGLRTTLYNKGLATSAGVVSDGTNGSLMIGELGSCLNCASADFQDAILQMQSTSNYCQ